MDGIQNFYFQALDAVSSGILIIDGEGLCIYVNLFALSLLEKNKDKVVGQHIHNIVHGISASHTAVNCPLIACINGNESKANSNDEFFLYSGLMPVEVQCHPLLRGEQRVSMVSFVALASSEDTEKLNHQNQSMFHAIFQAFTGAVFLLSPLYIIKEANSAALTVLSRDKVEGENFFRLFPDQARSELERVLKEVTSVSTKRHVVRFPTSKGRDRFFEIDARLFVTDNLHMVIVRDVTSLILEQRARDQFISVAGHELKTPLTVIKAFTQLVAKKTKSINDDKLHHYLNTIDAKTDQLTYLINTMMESMKIGSGKIQFNNECVNVVELISTLVGKLEDDVDCSRIKVVSTSNVTLCIDPTRLSQVMRHLITNACKYSPKEKNIDIVIGEDDNTVVIRVKDYGIGLSESELSRLFEPFYRSPNSPRDGTAGLGLGLFVSNQIITRYGGRIDVVSSEGNGAEFIRG